MGKVIMSGRVPKLMAPEVAPDVEVGTIWLFTEDGTFTVPADGNYQIEMHGGGGGSVAFYTIYSGTYKYYSAGGGGSGLKNTKALQKGEEIPVSIGAGGDGTHAATTDGTSSTLYAGDGGTTSFGDLTCPGGGGATFTDFTPTGGSAAGDIATDGEDASASYSSPVAAGGYGNSDNTSQTYGNGGSAGGNSQSLVANDGQPGAVIITYLGVA